MTRYLLIGSIRGPFRVDFCPFTQAIRYATRWA